MKFCFLLFLSMLCFSQGVSAKDLFSGKYISESRENFGPPNEANDNVITINIVPKADHFVLSIFHNNVFKYDVEAKECDPENEGYLKDHPSGEVHVLCSTDKYGSSVISYSENGIKVPVINKTYKAKYYAHIQWSIWAFRKLE